MNCECGQPIAEFHEAFVRGLCAACAIAASLDRIEQIIAEITTERNN